MKIADMFKCHLFNIRQTSGSRLSPTLRPWLSVSTPQRADALRLADSEPRLDSTGASSRHVEHHDALMRSCLSRSKH